jgi:hypothetical protein
VHKRISFHGDAQLVGALLDELAPITGVITATRGAGGSAKPPGDVLELEVLNRDADEVLRRAGPFLDRQPRRLVMNIAASNALVDRQTQALIDHDADEMLWEEMESDLRNRGRITANYLALMALGGAITAAALLFDPVTQMMAFVGASIVAPGFEPLAKMAQGLALRERRVCARAMLSLVVGYAVLLASAALTYRLLAWDDLVGYRARLLDQPVMAAFETLQPAGLLASAGAATAGVLMVVSLRDLYVVGPLMAMILIVGVSVSGAALGAGAFQVAALAARRAVVDMGWVVVLGAGVFFWKQRRFHRRRPLT